MTQIWCELHPAHLRPEREILTCHLVLPWGPDLSEQVPPVLSILGLLNLYARVTIPRCFTLTGDSQDVGADGGGRESSSREKD